MTDKKTYTIAERKLLDAFDKIELLKENLDRFDINSQIEHAVAIKQNAITDADVRDDFKKTSAPCELHKKFAETVNSFILSIIKCKNVENEVSHLLLVFSKSHGYDYNVINQMLCDDNGKFTYYDVPLLAHLSKICNSPNIVSAIEKIVLECYKDAFYDRAEVILTGSYFISNHPGLKQNVVQKYTHALESIFRWERFATLYRSISNPFDIKDELREEAYCVLLEILEKVSPYMIEKIQEFANTQLFRIQNEIHYFFDSYSETSKLTNEFLLQMKNKSYNYKRIDIREIAFYYTDIVADRCNLFYHADCDEDSGFFKTITQAYVSVAVSIFENLTEETRERIKKEVFSSIENQISWNFDNNITLTFECFKRPKAKYQSNDSSDRGCYITTVVCEYLGKNDNCYELQTLRWFRDNWLLKMEDGEKYIKLYYDTAPEIVKAIQNDKNKDVVFTKLRQKIQEAIKFIERKKYNDAFNIYSSMVKSLLNIYKI